MSSRRDGPADVDDLGPVSRPPPHELLAEAVARFSSPLHFGECDALHKLEAYVRHTRPEHLAISLKHHTG